MRNLALLARPAVVLAGLLALLLGGPGEVWGAESGDGKLIVVRTR